MINLNSRTIKAWEDKAEFSSSVLIVSSTDNIKVSKFTKLESVLNASQSIKVDVSTLVSEITYNDSYFVFERYGKALADVQLESEYNLDRIKKGLPVSQCLSTFHKYNDGSQVIGNN